MVLDKWLPPKDFDKAGVGLEAAMAAFPVLRDAPVNQWLHGPDTHTPDHGFLLGPLLGVDNVLTAGGFNSQGIQCGPGVGQALAEWALEGYPSSATWRHHFEDLSMARFNPEVCAQDAWVAYRALESYGGTYQAPRKGKGS